MIHESKFQEIELKLKNILKNYNTKITSFKWTKMKTDNKINALIEFLTFLFPYLDEGFVNISVLKWSIHDKRHDVLFRDDLSNLSFMYYKLIVDMINRKTKDGDCVFIFPDHNDVIDWINLENYIYDKVFNKIDHDSDLLISSYQKKVFLKPSTTSDCSLIQIADIFAGIARTSFDDYYLYEVWLNSQQSRLFPFEEPSRAQKYRFRIYELIDIWAKNNKYQISLKKNGGFHSYNPNSPLNFWVYKPQNENDKAPTK